VQAGIKVIAIVFNNQSFGNVLRDQKTVFAGRYIGESLTNPDFVRLAESFGAAAFRAIDAVDLRSALIRARAVDRPVVIEVPGAPGSEASPWPFLHPWTVR
jgi:acetolactate synthase-1/2/3 large subunit